MEEERIEGWEGEWERGTGRGGWGKAVTGK